MRKRPIFWACALLAPSFGMAPGSPAPEDQASPKPQFEVASLKPADPSQRPPAGAIVGKIIGGPGTADPGQLRGMRVTLFALIRTAYDLTPDQLSGPGWLKDQTYELTAKVPQGSSKDELKLMLQGLLVDRFRLTFHREPKEVPAYALTIAANGSKLKPTAYPDASPLRPGASGPSSTLDSDGYPAIPAGKSGAAAVPRDGLMFWTFQSVPVAALISNIQVNLGSMIGMNMWSPGRVRDETGLTGKYDFKLSYSGSGQIGDGLQTQGVSVSAAQAGIPVMSDPAGPDLFNAVEKQLGLKLVKRKVVLEMFAIDHVERIPTGN